MKIIKVKTKRGLELKGAMYDSGKNEIALIMITGICSNVFQNELLDAAGKLLSQSGITTVIAHTMDSFSCFAYSDHCAGKQKLTGVYNDDFNIVYEDVKSYVLHVKKLGFKKIILAGHSLVLIKSYII